jgi:hypothetical protein
MILLVCKLMLLLCMGFGDIKLGLCILYELLYELLCVDLGDIKLELCTVLLCAELGDIKLGLCSNINFLVVGILLFDIFN